MFKEHAIYSDSKQFNTYRHVRPSSFAKRYIGAHDLTFEIFIDGDELSAGVAVCSHSDNFCKETGRHVSSVTFPRFNTVYDPRMTLVENIFYGLRGQFADKDSPVHTEPEYIRWRMAFKTLAYELGVEDFNLVE